MRMKRVYHPETRRYGFFIGKVNDHIMVIPYGAAHIYEYMQALEKEIKRLSSKIKKEKIKVYIDLSPILKKGIVLQFDYSKKNNFLNWLSPCELTLKELPEPIRKNLKGFYEKKKKIIIESMLPSETKKFSTIISRL